MIRLEKSNDSRWYPEEFETQEDFIEYTINAARENATGGDESELMSQWGFLEVVDLQKFDEDGEEIEFKSHYEGDYGTCKNYWEKWHGHVPGGHWVIVEE